MSVEILAPGGSVESVTAAVRTGADAVYLGGSSLNARGGATGFAPDALREIVSYCHGRGVAVHLTLNTIVFDDELKVAEGEIEAAAAAGVDAFIIQDLGVAALAKACAPEIRRHGSTQMSVHNLWGVEQLAKLGFHRVVLARELTGEEIQRICKESPLEIECFVHGALCSSVSGQCYLSSMIGGRSGNRGRCAQPCRLPFGSEGADHALSLKDLSVISQIPQLAKMGVGSFKIEGRLKRPEYVAAAVTACRQVLVGEQPDYGSLEAVFSRSGFTDGYLTDQMGEEMFGRRTKEDVAATGSSLKELAGLYHRERSVLPVDMELKILRGQPTILTASSGGRQVTVMGDPPQQALTAPTTWEKARGALGKTGNTPFLLNQLEGSLDEGMMVPGSQLNGLRREVLEQLVAKLEEPQPRPFVPYLWEKREKRAAPTPFWRVRVARVEQISPAVLAGANQLVCPIGEVLANLERWENKETLLLELPRLVFREQSQSQLVAQLEQAKKAGFTQVITGDYGGVYLAQKMGFVVHGDFGLNLVNTLSVDQWAAQGLATVTMSPEYGVQRQQWAGSVARGLLVYGQLPLMIFRNHPAGLKEQDGQLTDRLGNRFPVRQVGDGSELYNMVPLVLSDRMNQVAGLNFYTLYFTTESGEDCQRVLEAYEAGASLPAPFTRGLYQRRVL